MSRTAKGAERRIARRHWRVLALTSSVTARQSAQLWAAPWLIADADAGPCWAARSSRMLSRRFYRPVVKPLSPARSRAAAPPGTRMGHDQDAVPADVLADLAGWKRHALRRTA